MIAVGLNRVRIALLWVLCLGVALASWRFMIWGVEASMGFVAHHAAMRPIAFYGHVVLAPIALALVPFQLWQGFRNKRPKLHRLMGRVYGIAVILSGMGGLWLAMTTNAGPVAAWGFGLLAVAWLGTTSFGISFAMRGDYERHRRWMIRSVALTLAAVTLRLYLPLGFALGMAFPVFYPGIAWLCWVPNAVVAELVLLWSDARARKTMARVRTLRQAGA